MYAAHLSGEPRKVAVTIAISKCFRIHRSWGTCAFNRNSSVLSRVFYLPSKGGNEQEICGDVSN